MSGFEDSLPLFLKGFRARDIAASLASFDETTPQAAIGSALGAQELEVAGIRRSGKMAGWVARAELSDSQDPAPCRSFDAESIIDDSAGLHEVVEALNRARYLFVRSFGEVNGLVRRSDLEKPAARMWLFGLITVMELRVTRLIEDYLPDDSWRQYLSVGRLNLAHTLQEERRRRGQHRSLLECLHFADKGRIMSRELRLRQHTRFTSRKEVENFVQGLQDLRNNLAHAQDLAGDWEVICELAANLHQIVVGKPTAIEASASAGPQGI